MKRKLKQAQDAPLATLGEVFEDGSCIELVGDPTGGRLQLVLCEAGRITTAPQVKHGGLLYRPAAIDRSVLRALRFPARYAECGSGPELLGEIYALFRSYIDLDECAVRLLAHFVLATWFVDCVQLAPSIQLVGTAASEANAVLKLLGCLCRRPLLLSELTATHFCSVPLFLRPTLLIAQGRSSHALGNLLRASCRHGFHVRNGKLIDPFGAKAIYIREPSEGISLDCLEIAIRPMHGQKSTLNDVVMKQIADQFQPRLMSYRLHNLKKARASSFDVPSFSAVIRDHARTLGACVNDSTARAELTQLLRQYDEQLRAEETLRLECVVLEAMLFLCHEKNKKSVLVEDVSEVVNAMLVKRGVSLPMQPRGVGAKLKLLGFHTRRLGYLGRGIVLTQEISQQAHRLAARYNLTSTQIVDGCSDCQNETSGNEDAPMHVVHVKTKEQLVCSSIAPIPAL